jgi:hypothetical protein
MRRTRTAGRRDLRTVVHVGVWGVHQWDAARVWGYHDTTRARLYLDKYSGLCRWGRGYWTTDFWLRWKT